MCISANKQGLSMLFTSKNHLFRVLNAGRSPFLIIFKYRHVTIILKKKLEECNMVNVELWNTFTLDIIQANGKIATSAIDHIYLSKELEPEVTSKKLDCSFSDHLLIIAILNKSTKRKCQPRTIPKRCLNFYFVNVCIPMWISFQICLLSPLIFTE